MFLKIDLLLANGFSQNLKMADTIYHFGFVIRSQNQKTKQLTNATNQTNNLAIKRQRTDQL